MMDKDHPIECGGPYSDQDIDSIRIAAKQGKHYLQGVIGREPFVYTLGLSIVGLPEIIITGNDGRSVGFVINIFAEMMRERGKGFYPGEKVEIGGDYPLMAIDADASAATEYTFQATRLMEGRPYRIIQMLVPDPKGRYPFEPDYDPKFWVQPILGPLPPGIAGAR